MVIVDGRKSVFSAVVSQVFQGCLMGVIFGVVSRVSHPLPKTPEHEKPPFQKAQRTPCLPTINGARAYIGFPHSLKDIGPRINAHEGVQKLFAKSCPDLARTYAKAIPPISKMGRSVQVIQLSHINSVYRTPISYTVSLLPCDGKFPELKKTHIATRFLRVRGTQQLHNSFE